MDRTLLARRPHPLFSIYRLEEAPDLFCAVSTADPVPAFLAAGRWRFERRVTEAEEPPPGFRPRAAHCGTRLNGFYLFYGQ